MSVIEKDRVVEGSKATEPDNLIPWLRTGGVVEKKAREALEEIAIIRDNPDYTILINTARKALEVVK